MTPYVDRFSIFKILSPADSTVNA